MNHLIPAIALSLLATAVGSCVPGSVPPDDGVLDAVTALRAGDASAFAGGAVVVDDRGVVDVASFIDNELDGGGAVAAHHDVARVRLNGDRLLFAQVVAGEVVVAAVLPVPGEGTGVEDDDAARYQQAWNVADADARSTLLVGAFSDDGRYVDPTVDVRGRAGLVDHISTWRAGQAGSTIAPVGGVVQRGPIAAFAWRIIGGLTSDGMDLCVRDDDGSLALVAGFFGPL